ncbi:MAG: LytTR family DNA-binding domain-containing protein [Bacteroidota bacterium]
MRLLLLLVFLAPAALAQTVSSITFRSSQTMDGLYVDWIEASGNYVTVHAGGARHLIRTSLTRVASRLDPRRFLRIHRSTVVHLDRVRSLVPASHGDYTVVLHDGTALNMSRTYREHLQRVLELGF